MHTADWHLGCSMGAEKRFEEYDALLAHLCSIIRDMNIEAVIIAGDVFDVYQPPNRAAEQYYRFLLEAGRAGAREIIVTGGNHDSAAYLEAPGKILEFLSVHVFASASQDPADMIVELRESSGVPAALVAAIPYLHEGDIVAVEGGSGAMEREKVLKGAMLKYYSRTAEAMNNISSELPHIVTGHLFAADRGEKNTSWTGTLMSVDTAEFPASIDYLALGHLHDARTLKSPHSTCVRYPGAPVAVSFRELDVPKSVTVIDTEDVKNICEIPLPSFQDMRRLEGCREELEKELAAIAASADHSIWCSVENTGSYEPGLWENLNMLIRDTPVKIIVCRNRESNPAVLQRLPEERHLADLAPADVFKLLLQESGVNGEETEPLLEAFREIETAVAEEGNR